MMKGSRKTLFSLLIFFWSFWSFSGVGLDLGLVKEAQASQGEEVFISLERAGELIAAGAAVLDARERGDYRSAHVPGAANLPWGEFVEGSASGRLIDDDQRLGESFARAGVSKDRPVLVYGNWSEAGAWGEEGRLFWTLEYLGHERVHILEGGFPAWKAANLPASGAALGGLPGGASPAAGDFQVNRNEERRISTTALRGLFREEGVVLLDTREAEEYAGEVKYGEARGGRIPGAKHLWWADLFDEKGELKSREALQEEFQALGIERDSQIIAYCTGGIRSGFVYAALRSLGYEQVVNYDASMWEWTAVEEHPLE